MIGKHNDRVVIRGRAANVPDGYGGVIEAFTDKWEGFAEVRKTSGSKAIQAGAVDLSNTFEITIRKKPGLNIIKTDMIDYGTRKMGIVSIDDTDKRWLTIIATATT